MTILQSLAAFYDRLDRRGRDGVPLVPAPGLKPVEIDYILEIDRAGKAVALKQRAIPEGRRRAGKLMMPGTVFNPKADKGSSPWEDLSFGGRTSGRRSFVFWDKTSYVFGVAARKGAGGKPEPDVSKKSLEDHAAFKVAHDQLLSDASAPEFQALKSFLEAWQPSDWQKHSFPTDALDKNIAFEVSGARVRVDQMPQARELARSVIAARTEARHCLISGEIRPFAAKHPLFRGVAGAQSSGAMIVSYNADSFISFDADKAATAPVSEEAAFKYGAALNWLLERDNGRRFRLGETTIVYWADEGSVASGEPAAIEAEKAIAWEFTDTAAEDDEPVDGSDDEASEDYAFDVDRVDAPNMTAQAQDVRHLRRAPDPSKLDPATRIHVLGLSPNAGRIAIRFWLVDTWGAIGANIQRHKAETAIEPPDRSHDKKAYALLYEVAVQRKAENIPPRLGGELARAILTGAPYPQTLFASVVGRIRSDKLVNAARASLCRAIVSRNYPRSVPVALDPESADGAYNLGRLFATYEYAEKSVADRNASIRDKYIGAASATPRRVFPILMRGYEHNASALSKDAAKRGSGIVAAKAVSQILGRFTGENPFPTAFRLEEQGRFFVGYYHQMQSFYTKRDSAPSDTTNAEGNDQ